VSQRIVVLDTNILLDLLVFNDPACQPLMAPLASGSLRWLATQPMRDELERVLAYPKIIPRLAFYGLEAEKVLAQFDALVQLQGVPPKAPYTCKDPDDQKFVDLAVAHQNPLQPCWLLSKDRAILCMAKRLAPGVFTGPAAINVVAKSCQL
jgi:putative PIN family toxin of toxin-antitoxin system